MNDLSKEKLIQDLNNALTETERRSRIIINSNKTPEQKKVEILQIQSEQLAKAIDEYVNKKITFMLQTKTSK